MKRTFLFAVALSVLAAAHAIAQHPAGHDSLAKAMDGTWSGPFTTDHGPGGTMSVLVSHEGDNVKATMTISLHPDMPASPLNNIKHEAGGKISWTQETGGMSCTGTATMNTDGALAGGLDCGHAKLDFTLTKATPAKTK